MQNYFCILNTENNRNQGLKYGYTDQNHPKRLILSKNALLTGCNIQSKHRTRLCGLSKIAAYQINHTVLNSNGEIQKRGRIGAKFTTLPGILEDQQAKGQSHCSFIIHVHTGAGRYSTTAS